jgi:ABC-type nitrate/sulfonate/bicarbonate transport system substrate-binding protein
VLDVRRGDGPKPCFNYTMASIACSDRLIERSPETAAAAVRAMVKTHAALKQNVALATEIGRKLFPPSEAELIAELIRRDLPYYDASISRDFVAGMNQFSRDVGNLKGDAIFAFVEGRVEGALSCRWAERRAPRLLAMVVPAAAD